MMVKTAIYSAIFALSVASPAFAGPVDNSADQIASLTQLVSVSPRDGGVYAELAGAYVRAGRVADAMTAYRRVLALDNVMLETRNGDAVWSHEVARKALATTETLTSL
jgi:Flp pilus assembly protein TadD